MEYTEYKDPKDFLAVTRHVFEEKESVYGLMLGISLRLTENLFHYGDRPLFATITDGDELELVALMTPPHKLQIAVVGNCRTEAVGLFASEMHAAHWAIPAVLAEETVAALFSGYWNQLAGTRNRAGMRQRIYEIRAVTMPESSGSFRQATLDDMDIADKWASSFHADCFGESETKQGATKPMIEAGELFLWVDPFPVSMALLVRPTTHGIGISYVYTPPELRRNGYASSVVAHLSQQELDSGREFCTVVTDLSNPTSNSIYQKIGYVQVADMMDMHLVRV